MRICVDGDNAPGANTKGINKLSDIDKVIVFYASNNKYYCAEANREKLLANANCEVEFRSIPAGDCAVDIAIAMYAAQAVLTQEPQIMVLVSEDKHFGIIARQAQSMSKDWLIAQESNIENALHKYRLPEAGSLYEFHEYLVRLYGYNAGTDLYKKLGDQFKRQENKKTNEKKHVKTVDLIRTKLFPQFYKSMH